jgi:hypothetical protein
MQLVLLNEELDLARIPRLILRPQRSKHGAGAIAVDSKLITAEELLLATVRLAGTVNASVNPPPSPPPPLPQL